MVHVAKYLSLLLFSVALTVSANERSLEIPPPQVASDSLRWLPLLMDAQGNPIKTRRAWRRQRKAIQQRWLDFLGPFPKTKSSLKAETLATEDLAEFTREFVKYQVEEGVFTDGYLLMPKNAQGKLPAIVVFHPTTPLQAKGVSGLDASYPQEKWQAVQLVRRGYVVWCPRNYIFSEGADWKANAERVLARHPNWTGMTRMIWDAIRAADYLESLPRVDKKRIGCLGHSLGGKEVLYAMAFDQRYRAGVSSEGGIGLKFSNWDALWYLGPKIRELHVQLENHQVLALVAPRPFLLLAGDSADGDQSWAFIEAAKPVYTLLGGSENIGWFNHHGGHNYPPQARAVAEEFLDAHLKR